MGKVLVLDDELDILNLVRIILSQKGYDVLATSRIDEFYALLDDEVKLILLDVVMPEKTGIEICRELKKDPVRSKIPVIVFSASGSNEKKEAAIQAGADAFLLKPFSIIQLTDIVNRHYPLSLDAEKNERNR
ncbi:MAG: response regulator [Candidatus Hodarchaeales archaeon]